MCRRTIGHNLPASLLPLLAASAGRLLQWLLPSCAPIWLLPLAAWLSCPALPCPAVRFVPYVPPGKCASACASMNMLPLQEPQGKEVCVTRAYYKKETPDFYGERVQAPPA